MKKLNRLKIFYQQHILPIVYDYSMSLSEVVQKLVKVVNNLVDEVGDIEDKTGIYDDKIAALESKAADQGVYNEHINTAIEEINNTISELPTYDVIEDIRTDITNINSSVADLDTRVTVLEGQNIYQRLDTAEHNIANLGNDIDALELDVSNINMEISGIKNRIDNLEDCCTDVQGDILTINEDMSDMLDDITDLQTAVSGKSTVSFNQIQTSGNKIGEITIDGQTTDIYSPSSGGSTVSVTIPQSGVDSLAVITVDGVDYNITAQNGDNIWLDSLRYPGTRERLSNVLSDAYSGLDSAIFDINRKVFLDYQKDPGEYIDYPINQQALSGHLTGSSKSVYIFIPFNKNLFRIDSSYSFTISGNITIRAINGYLRDSGNTYNFNNIDIATYNPQVFKNELGFRLVLTLPATATATNNTPITAYFSGNGKIRITVL